MVTGGSGVLVHDKATGPKRASLQLRGQSNQELLSKGRYIYRDQIPGVHRHALVRLHACALMRLRGCVTQLRAPELRGIPGFSQGL